MIVDAHHHFWRFDPVEFDWIDDAMARIRRDFLPPDLWPELAATGVERVVSVQARQTRAETEMLLAFAAGSTPIVGVVGWVDLRARDVGAELARVAASPKLKGVRHVVQGEADENFILRADFNRGICELRKHSLAYDLLIFPRHLPQTIRFVDTHPDQIFILDHLAKPRIRAGEFEPWNRHLRELARRPNVYGKVSGLVTEADFAHWTEEQLRPYFDAALDAFGPRRLMFGSDWPVCLVASAYAQWYDVVKRWIAKLSPDEQARMFGGTAVEAYRL